MNKAQLRAKLTLPNLKSICRKFDIQGLVGGRKKEPYVNALFSFISARPCALNTGGLPGQWSVFIRLQHSGGKISPSVLGCYLQ